MRERDRRTERQAEADRDRQQIKEDDECVCVVSGGGGGGGCQLLMYQLVQIVILFMTSALNFMIVLQYYTNAMVLNGAQNYC